MSDISSGTFTFEPSDVREESGFHKSWQEILRFQRRGDVLALVVDGKDIWVGPDLIAFATWLARTVAALDAAEADKQRAVEAEREACAVIAESYASLKWDEWYGDYFPVTETCAAAIRKQGGAP